MGTWEIGIYSSDDALDVRDDFRDMLCYGWEPEKALRQLVTDHQLDASDSDSVPGILALCDTAWKYGCYSETFREMFCRAVETERASKDMWMDLTPGNRRKRIAILERLESKLADLQPAFHRPKKPRLYEMPWHLGGVYTFSIPDSEKKGALLVTHECMYAPGGKYVPENEKVKDYSFVFLHWMGDSQQLAEEIQDAIPICAAFFPKKDRTIRYEGKYSTDPFSRWNKSAGKVFEYCMAIELPLIQIINKTLTGTHRFSDGYEANPSKPFLVTYHGDGHVLFSRDGTATMTPVPNPKAIPCGTTFVRRDGVLVPVPIEQNNFDQWD